MLYSTFLQSGALGRMPLSILKNSFSAQSLTDKPVVDVKVRKRRQERYTALSPEWRRERKPGHAVLQSFRPGTSTGTSITSALYRSPAEIFEEQEDAASHLCVPYLEAFWNSLHSTSHGLQEVPMAAELSHQHSLPGVSKVTEMHSWHLKSDQLRRVRLIAINGEAFRGFNICCYPDLRFDLPLLGIELLIFGGRSVLLAVDFQPLHQSQEYLERHTASLADVYTEVSPFCTEISQRHYTPDRFRSSRIIFARSATGVTDAAMQPPHGKLFAAYKAYVHEYLRQLSSATPNESPQHMADVARAQDSYDAYMADRDPAGPMLVTYFGKEFTAQFQREFLFCQDGLLAMASSLQSLDRGTDNES